MARIAGVDIPREKHVQISLTYIFGVGRSTARRVCQRTQVAPTKKVSELTDDEVNRIREIVERELTVEGDLRRQVRQNVQRLIDIGCYRGMRHRRNLPVRGQRTRTNARTRRGPRKTVGVKKKAAAKK
jgi:small subunit ribosomal protein S13